MTSYFAHPGGGAFGEACAALCERRGLLRAAEVGAAAFAIAPGLTRYLGGPERCAPELGTLVFHPSALPYGRGRDAIRWSVARGERVSASTWFWASAGLDEGPICEQEVVVLAPGERPRDAYERRFIPAGLRALDRALAGIAAGTPRRVRQDPSLATYDPPRPRRPAPPPRLHPPHRADRRTP